MQYPESAAEEGIGGKVAAQYPEPAAGEGIGRNVAVQYPERICSGNEPRASLN